MITSNALDSVFHALAHVTRREILDIARDKPGLTVGELAKHFDVSRIAVMNHLTVLTQANLIISQKDGRSRRLYLNAMPIQEIYEEPQNYYCRGWTWRPCSCRMSSEGRLRR